MTAPVSRDPGFVPGLEGVVAFESEIAEPDKDGGNLRYRGVDIEDLVGNRDYAQVWGLLVDGSFRPGLPAAEPFPVPVHSGDIRVDVQSALAMLAPLLGARAAHRHQRRAGARRPRPRLGDGAVVRRAGRPRSGPPRGAAEAASTACATVTERFMTRWRGEPDPSARGRGRRVLDLGGRARRERLDLHRPRRCLDRRRRRRVPFLGDRRAVRSAARRCALPRPRDARRGRGLRRRREVGQGRDGPRRPADGLRPPGVYRAEDPRARVLRRTAQDLGSRRYEVAEKLEAAAIAELTERYPGPAAADQRGVLVGGRPRLRRGAAVDVHVHVHVRADRRLVGAHPGAEAAGQAHPPLRPLRRPRPAQAPPKSPDQPPVPKGSPCPTSPSRPTCSPPTGGSDPDRRRSVPSS